MTHVLTHVLTHAVPRGCRAVVVTVVVAVVGVLALGEVAGQENSSVRGNAFTNFTRDLGPNVNTTSNEWGPTLSADDLVLIFSSNRPGGSGNYDLYMATRPTTDGPFTEVVNLGPSVNSWASDWNGAITADHKTLFIVSASGRGGQGGNEIWMSTRESVDQPFGTAVIQSQLNSPNNDHDLCLSKDDLKLFFCSHRPGSRGRGDVWVSVRESTADSFGTPMHLNEYLPGSLVNSFYEERGPSISGDESALFFSEGSNDVRPGGLGDADIWVSMRADPDDPASPFGTPVNLNDISILPVNTSMYDGMPSISKRWPETGSQLFFFSFGGSWDIGRTTWLPLPQPDIQLSTTTCGDTPLVVDLDASGSLTPEGTTITSYEWDFGDGEPPAEGPSVSHTYTEAGRYDIQLTVTNDGGGSWTARASACALCPSGEVAGPWTVMPIGDPAYPGSAWLGGGEGGQDLNLCVGGAGIAGRAGDFLFVSQELSGSFQLTARIQELTGSSGRYEAGLMFSATGDADSGFAAMFYSGRETASGQVVRFGFRTRMEPGAGTRSTLRNPDEEPQGWLRLERRGNQFIGLTSLDGATWVEYARETLNLPETILAGVFGAGGDFRPDLPGTFQPARVRFSDLNVDEDLVSFVRGDCNSDGQSLRDVSDAIFLLLYNFLGGREPDCMAACDVNGDGKVTGTVDDAVYMLQFSFLGGAAPLPPFPECGAGTLPTDDGPEGLGCATPPDVCR